MAKDQIVLQFLRVFGRDLDRGELAKSGVHTVDRLIARRGPAHQFRRGLHPGPRVRVQPYRRLRTPYRFKIAQPRFTRFQGQHRTPPIQDSCSGLSPIR